MTVIVRGHMILDKALLRSGPAVLGNFMVEDPVFDVSAEMRVGIADHAPVSHISITQRVVIREYSPSVGVPLLFFPSRKSRFVPN